MGMQGGLWEGPSIMQISAIKVWALSDYSNISLLTLRQPGVSAYDPDVSWWFIDNPWQISLPIVASAEWGQL
jgi:hypothetical protein